MKKCKRINSIFNICIIVIMSLALSACSAADSQNTADSQSTAEGQDTADSQSTAEGQDTADSQSTAEGQDTADHQSTADGQSTADDQNAAEVMAGGNIAPEIINVTISATGDCTLGNNQEQSYDGSFNAYYDQNGQDYFFDGVREIFEADDFTVVNLECVLTEENSKVDKRWNLKGKPEYVGIMTGSSIEACSLGNNHTLDYGEQSLEDTKNVLDNAGVVYGYNDITGTYTTDSGIKIGIISVNLLSQNDTKDGYIRDGIETLRAQETSLIVVCCHWGIEREYYPNDYQVNMAHQIIDWGADLVIGNHPHVLQGIELYNGKMICYSLGNFCFGGNKNPTEKNTAIFQQTFQFVDGQLQNNVNARIIPCTLSGQKSYNDFQPAIAETGKKQEIISLMNTYSTNYSNIEFDEDGKLCIRE